MGETIRTFALLLLLGMCSAPFAYAQDTPKPQPVVKDLNYYVTGTLNQVFDELRLGDEHRKRLESEVLVERPTDPLTDPMAFVTGYNSTREGTYVQVDREKLRDFLSFSHKLFKDDPVVCLMSQAASGCGACEGVRERVDKLLRSRFEQRGFRMREADRYSEDTALSGERAFAYYVARAAESRCDGILYSEVAPAPGADANADESENASLATRATFYLLLRDTLNRKVSVKAKAELAANKPEDLAPFKKAMGRGLAELFSAAAAKSASPTVVAVGNDERYLRLEGVSSYGAYVRFKQTALTGIPGLKLEERVISPGSFQFAVSGTQDLGQVVNRMKELQWGTYRLEVLHSGPSEAAVALR